MRITCPDCGSVYDVPERAVPNPGRDVQCAACGASWFLLKRVTAPHVPGAPAAGAIGGAREADRLPADAQSGAPQATPRAGAAAPDRVMGRPDGGGSGTDANPRPEDAFPPRRRVDPQVLAILREEAETEQRARATATGAAAAGPATSDVPNAARAAADRKRADDTSPSPEARAGTDDDSGHAPGAMPPQAFGDHKAALPDARGRVARLTAAERDARNRREGQGTTAWDILGGDTDDGLVEDVNAALRGAQLPLVEAMQPAPPSVSDQSAVAGLPVAVRSPDQHALVILEHRRRGFRLGFATTAGLCCAALAVYLLALRADEGFDGPVVEAVRHHGGQVQAALVEWLRRVVAPALS